MISLIVIVLFLGKEDSVEEEDDNWYEMWVDLGNILDVEWRKIDI